MGTNKLFAQMPTNALSPADIHHILTSANERARDQFLTHFSSEIQEIATCLSAAYARFIQINSGVPQDERSGWTQSFLYSGFDCLVSATQLLVYGHMLAAGNLMRGWSEAMVMALLCSSDQVNTFDRFFLDPLQYSVHKALGELRRRGVAKILQSDMEGLDQLKEINDFYSDHSHTSAWAVSTRKMFSDEGALVLAGEFDLGKIDYYRRELQMRRSACDRLVEIIVAVEHHLTCRTKG